MQIVNAKTGKIVEDRYAKRKRRTKKPVTDPYKLHNPENSFLFMPPIMYEQYTKLNQIIDY